MDGAMKHHEVEPKVGGFLLITGYGESLAQIDAITEHHIISDKTKYCISSGREVGALRWNRVATAISDESAEKLGREWRLDKECKTMRAQIAEFVRHAEHADLLRVLHLFKEIKKP